MYDLTAFLYGGVEADIYVEIHDDVSSDERKGFVCERMKPRSVYLRNLLIGCMLRLMNYLPGDLGCDRSSMIRLSTSCRKLEVA